MNRIGPALLAAALLFLAAASPAEGQVSNSVRSRIQVTDSLKLHLITLTDGSSLVGRIVRVSTDSIEFQNSVARMSLAIVNIRDAKQVPATVMRNGEYWFPNPNATRLLFAPTAQMLAKGDGYFSDYYIFFPGIAYGLTDNVTIGGGVSLFPVGLSDQVYFLTPKIGGMVADRVHLAAGILYGRVEGGSGGIAYGVTTFGDGEGSVTLGAGYGFSGSKVSNNPAALVGAEKRVSRRIALVTENYLLPVSTDNLLYSFGVRFMSDRLTTDLALFNVAGSGFGIGVPWLDFVFKF